MTQSVYVLGAAGVGKSTFTAALLSRLQAELGPLEELHAKRNAKALVTLRGHRWPMNRARINGEAGGDGVYLGVMREEFPGSDGLDRASSPTGAEWLENGDMLGSLPRAILGEGATLATRPFLTALHQHTNLWVFALRCDPMVHDLRLAARGAGQDESFITSTVTKTENLVADLEKMRARVRWVDTDEDYRAALLAAELHLQA